MNRAALYAVRMVLFVSIWVFAFWMVLELAPLRQLPIGLFTWILFELALGAVNRRTGKNKRGHS